MTYEDDDQLLNAALRIAEQRLTYVAAWMTSPQVVSDYLQLWSARLTEEAFGVLWLTNKHQLIAAEVLAAGTISSANVYPRVVLRAGLKANAAACIVFHNHPSGDPTPSTADIALTKRLREALDLIDIQLLDHLVVGHRVVSLAELGLL